MAYEMKINKTLAMAACMILVPQLYAEPAPGVAEFDRSTAELTASLILEKLQTDVLNAEPDAASLATEMTADPGKYIDPDEARRNLETLFRNGISARYRDEAGKYLDRLSGSQGRGASFGDDFLKKAVELPGDKLSETVSRTYSGAFLSARGSVCQKQASALIAGIQPAEKEFEEIPLGRLSEIMTERVAAAQKGAVFKENLAYITDNIVRPMLEDAETQRNAQRAYVERQPVEGWTPAKIGKALEEGLGKFVAESGPRYQEAGKGVYGMFPSVVESIAGASEGRALDKFARVVDETVVNVDSAEILAEIEKSPLEHQTADASLKAFAPTMEKKLADEASTRCDALVPEDEKADFKRFAGTSLESGKIRDAISGRVRTVLLPEIKSIRDECAQRQLVKLFGEIVGGKWFPSGGLVDSVCEQVDYRKAVKGWRDFAEMEAFALTSREQPLMEETEKKLEAAVGVVFDRAGRARTRQHGIVDDVFDEMKTLFSSADGLPDMDAAVAQYTEKVSGVWGPERDAVVWGEKDAERPENADIQHADLFPSTVEKIRLKVKSLMESIEKERQEKEAQPETPPVETPPEAAPESPAPPEEPELIKLDCRFELDQKGDDILLYFYSGESQRVALTCPQSPSKYRKEYEKTVAGAVAALVSEVGGLTAKGSKVELKVEIFVKNDLVYYGIVDRLSAVLNAKTTELLETGVTMEVKDDMMQ